MALPATDSFTGTTGTALQTYSSNWSIGGGGLEINANHCIGSTAATNHGAAWNADTFDADQYCQAICNIQGDGSYLGPSVRASTSALTFYSVRGSNFGSNSRRLYKRIAGTNTTLQQDTTTITSGSVVRIEAEGTTIRTYDDGVQFFTDQTDASISSGAGGIAGRDTHSGTYVDDWEAGNLGADRDLVAFRFYDDGTESGSTALEAQNTDITIAPSTPFQLRAGMQATGDPAAEAAELWYKESGDASSEWRKVP